MHQNNAFYKMGCENKSLVQVSKSQYCSWVVTLENKKETAKCLSNSNVLNEKNPSENLLLTCQFFFI